MGVNASGGNSWNDAHVANCSLYYNKAGNLYFGGSQVSAGIEFVNCNTDANCGNGFEIVNEATSPTYRPDHILGEIKCVNCVVVNGKASDTGSGTIIGPKSASGTRRPTSFSG